MLRLNNDKKLLNISIFLVPTLLLTTPNFSVAVILILCIYSVKHIINHKKKLSNFDWIIIFCLGFYLISNIPNLITDLGNFRYIKGGSRILLCILIYLMLKDKIKTGLYIKASLSWGVFVGSIGALLIALYDFYILKEIRVNGFLFSINFGYLSSSLALLALCLAHSFKHKSLLYIAFFSSGVATILTVTRGAIFAIPIAYIFYFILTWKAKSLKHYAINASVILVLAISTYTVSPAIKYRVDLGVSAIAQLIQGEKNNNKSIGGRLLLWKAAYSAFKESPLIGLDYPHRKELNKKLYKEGIINKWADGVSRGHAHNQYFEMLASSGMLGIVAIFAMLILPLFIFLRHYLKTGCQMALTACIFVFGFMIYGLTEVPLMQNLISSYYGFMLALFFAYIRPADVSEETS